MRPTCFLLSFFFFIALTSNAQQASFATAGNGNMRNYISWFDWAGQTIANNASSTFTTADGLKVTIKISNVSGPTLAPYVMNTWSGAVLWNLYDFIDPAIKPALFSNTTLSQVN